jgi:aminopeptidase N
VNDSSYSVSGQALDGLTKLNPSEAYTLAKKYSSDALGKLGQVVSKAIMANATEEDFDIVLKSFQDAPLTREKVQSIIPFGNYLAKLKNQDDVKKGVEAIMDVRNQVPERFRKFIDPGIKPAFDKISESQKAQGHADFANYVDGLLK